MTCLYRLTTSAGFPGGLRQTPSRLTGVCRGSGAGSGALQPCPAPGSCPRRPWLASATVSQGPPLWLLECPARLPAPCGLGTSPHCPRRRPHRSLSDPFTWDPRTHLGRRTGQLLGQRPQTAVQSPRGPPPGVGCPSTATRRPSSPDSPLTPPSSSPSSSARQVSPPAATQKVGRPSEEAAQLRHTSAFSPAPPVSDEDGPSRSESPPSIWTPSPPSSRILSLLLQWFPLLPNHFLSAGSVYSHA